MRIPKTYWLLFFAVFASFCTHAMPAGNSPSATQFANVPVASFLENKGQIKDQYGKPRADIQFRMSGNGINIFIGNGQVHYQWDIVDTGSKGATYRMDMTLLGANKHARVIADEKREYFERLIARNEELTISSFNKVTYKDIYPGIDWVLYSKEGQLKYDFIVHPGGNPADIKMEYKHATTLAVENGVFTAKTPAGSITEDAPYCYDAVTRQVVPSAFKLNGKVLSFDVKTNGKHDLVIDPTIFWATYFGNGTSLLSSNDISTDPSGNVFLCGNTTGAMNFATVGVPYNTTGVPTGFEDAYLSKFSPTGARLWTVYWYFTDSDHGEILANDNLGNVYIAGLYNPAGYGYSTARLTKFSGNGAIGWTKESILGGDSYDVTVDKYNNIYWAGRGDVGGATSGTHQTSGPNFIVKYDNSGSKLWATYFGGGNDSISKISCDTFGNLYVCGKTNSTTLIATSGFSSIGIWRRCW